MDPEELEPKKSKGFEIGEDLSALSLDELKHRIAALKGEIARIEETIGAKESSKQAADSFFKS